MATLNTGPFSESDVSIVRDKFTYPTPMNVSISTADIPRTSTGTFTVETLSGSTVVPMNGFTSDTEDPLITNKNVQFTLTESDQLVVVKLDP